MPIPPFTSMGVIPEGRHQCTLDEIESDLVTAPAFAASSTRQEILADFLSAIDLLHEFDENLLERAWIGGGFASTSVNPSDLDVTFMLSEAKYLALSRRNQEKIAKLCRRDGFKAIGLKVDGFMFVHSMIANPWQAGWLLQEAVDYSARRGAWDDWWSRQRVHGAKDAPPIVEDAGTIRGYLEVVFDG